MATSGVLNMYFDEHAFGVRLYYADNFKLPPAETAACQCMKVSFPPSFYQVLTIRSGLNGCYV
jgi:hypothetical protein